MNELINELNIPYLNRTPAEMIAVNPKEVSPMDVDDIQRASNLSTNNAINVESTVAATQLDTNESVNIINSYTT